MLLVLISIARTEHRKRALIEKLSSSLAEFQPLARNAWYIDTFLAALAYGVLFYYLHLYMTMRPCPNCVPF